MATQEIQAHLDAWVTELNPSENSGTGGRLQLRATSGQIRQSFVYFSLPKAVLEGATVTSATLKLYLKGTQWVGTQQIIAKRVSTSWKERQLNWNNRPTEANGGVSDSGATTITVTNGTEGQEVTLDLTAMLQSVAAGAQWYGVRLTTNVSEALRLHSAESPAALKRPQLEITWAKIPLPPYDLRPSGSRSVTTSRPTLLWRFKDNFGDTSQAASQVQVYSLVDVLLYDSGMRANTSQEYNLETPLGGAFTALTNGQQVKWHVKCQDGDGLESDWSDFAAFRFDTVATLTLTNPGATVEETTPPVAWTHTGRTQEEVEVSLEEYDTADARFDKVHSLSRRVFTQSSYSIPKNVITKPGHDYRVMLKVWDTLDREDLPGARGYREVSRSFQYVRSGAPAAVTSLTAVPSVDPGVVLTWSRSAQPDWFALKVDGSFDRGDERIEPTDVFVSGTTYQATYWGALPGTSHTYEIEAVVTSGGGVAQQSDGNNTASAESNPIGIWLISPEDDLRVFMGDRPQPSEVLGESGTTFEPIGRRSPVRVVDSIRGFEGSISGLLLDYNGVTASEYYDRLLQIKGQRNTEDLRLVFASRNIPVFLEEISVTPSAEMIGLFQVSLAYRQSSEFSRIRM